MSNALNWFEIPAHDFERAVAFYERALGVTMKRVPFGAEVHALFSAERPGVGGAIVPQGKPSAGGTLVYLNVSGKLDQVLESVRAAGGEVLQGRTSIGELGAIAIMRDTEGNAVGLHTYA